MQSKSHLLGDYEVYSWSKDTTTHVLHIPGFTSILFDIGECVDSSIHASHCFLSSTDPAFSKGLIEHAYLRHTRGLPSTRYYLPMECVDEIQRAIAEFENMKNISLDMALFTLKPGDSIEINVSVSSEQEESKEQGEQTQDEQTTPLLLPSKYVLRVFSLHPKRLNLGFCLVKSDGNDTWTNEVCYTGINPLLFVERSQNPVDVIIKKYIYESKVLIVECSYVDEPKALHTRSQPGKLRGFVTAKQIGERLIGTKYGKFGCNHILLFHLPFDGPHNNVDFLAKQCSLILPTSEKHRIHLSLSAFGCENCDMEWILSFSVPVLPRYEKKQETSNIESTKHTEEKKTKRKKKHNLTPFLMCEVPFVHDMLLEEEIVAIDKKLEATATRLANISQIQGNERVAITYTKWKHQIIRVCFRSLTHLVNVHYLATDIPEQDVGLDPEKIASVHPSPFLRFSFVESPSIDLWKTELSPEKQAAIGQRNKFQNLYHDKVQALKEDKAKTKIVEDEKTELKETEVLIDIVDN